MKSLFHTLLVAVCLMTPAATGQISVRDASSTGSQASGALGILGDRFTIGGQPTFLLGVSYFDAQGWSHADLDALHARRFNLIRIFLDWSILAIKDGVPSPLAPRGFLSPDGSLKNDESLLNLIRSCATRGIMVDVTILTAIYDAANPTSKTLNVRSRENAIRNVVRLLKHEPNVLFDVCNEHDVAWNGKTTTLTHADVAALIRVALAEHPDAIVTVSSGGDHLPNAQNVRAELDAGAMLIAPHFQRTPDWFDRTDDRIKAVKEEIKAAGRKVPVYLQEEQRRGWTKLSPPKTEFLQAAREAVSAGAAGWVFHTHAGFDLRSSNFLANLDSVEREILDWLGTLTPVPLKQFSEDFFSTGSALQVLTSEQVVRADAKEYEENGWKIVAAQVEELGLDQFWKRKEELGYALEAMRKERGLDFACLLITDITLHYSLLLVRGHAKIIENIGYPQLDPTLFELEGIVSRKKQLLPALIRILNQVVKGA